MSKSYAVPQGDPKDKPKEEDQNSLKEKKPSVQCCIPSCTSDAVTRGLCSKCYSAASNLVKAKKATWEGLEGLGLAKPSQRNSSLNKFLEALAAKGKKKN